MKTQSEFALPLFAHGVSIANAEISADVALVLAHAKAHPDSGPFAYYQDEPDMAWYFTLKKAAEAIYGKGRARNDDLPQPVLDLIDEALTKGDRAMSLAEYREMPPKELAAAIRTLQKNISANKAALARLPAIPADASDVAHFEGEDIDDDEQPQRRKRKSGAAKRQSILDSLEVELEWLDAAEEEKRRRDATARYDYLADMIARATEKFGDAGMPVLWALVTFEMYQFPEDFNSQTQTVAVYDTAGARVNVHRPVLPQGDSVAAQRIATLIAEERTRRKIPIPEGYEVRVERRENDAEDDDYDDCEEDEDDAEDLDA